MARIFQCNTGSVVVPADDQEAYLAATAIRRSAASAYHLHGKTRAATGLYMGPYHLVLRNEDLTDEKCFQVVGEQCDGLRVMADGLYRICISLSVPNSVLSIQDTCDAEQTVAKRASSLQPKLHVVVHKYAPEPTSIIAHAAVGSFVPPIVDGSVSYSNIHVTCAVSLKADDSISFHLHDVVNAVGDNESFAAVPGETAPVSPELHSAAALKASIANPFSAASQRAIILVQLM